MALTDPDLDALVAQVRSSPRYRTVVPELVAAIGARELKAHHRVKEAARATRSKLHQVLGAFVAHDLDYQKALKQLQDAVADPLQFRRTCSKIMQSHASTRERLAILDGFYSVLFRGLPPPASVLDIACGLNPLSLPWMGLPTAVRYIACDATTDLTEFLQAFLDLAGVDGHAQACDVTRDVPVEPVDMAFILKSVPSLEQLDEQAAANLLARIRAACILVSFPVHSLGGREKGMTQHYARHFLEIVEHGPWDVQRFDFQSELVFRLLRR